MFPHRTIRLTERVPREVTLPRGDAARLAVAFGRSFDVVPVGRRYRVTALGCVGSLDLANFRVEVRPKIRDCEIFHLLGGEPPAFFDGTAWTPALVGWFGDRLAAALHERNAAGFRRGYVEQLAARPFLSGRLDVAAQLRQPTFGADFVCHADAFALDHPLHQYPKGAALALLASPYLSLETRSRLERAIAPLADVTARSDVIPVLDRLSADYAPLIDLASLILRQDGIGFLLPMEVVFERYLERELVREFGDAVVPQLDRAIAGTGGAVLRFRPDIVLHRDGRPAVILDAKWKHLHGAPESDDVHQVLAYAVAFGVADVRLVYPGRRDRVTEFPLPTGPTLRVHELRVTGSAEACRRGVRRLARSLCLA